MNPMNPPTKPTLETCAELIASAREALDLAWSKGGIEVARKAYTRACRSARNHGYTTAQLQEALASLPPKK